MTEYQALRIQYPRSRRAAVVGIASNGSRRTIIDCIVCGKKHTYATDWPQPVHAYQFRRHHSETCGRELILRAEMAR